MPLVNIDLLAGRSDDEIDRISDCVHEAMTAELDVPLRDRFQIVTEHTQRSLRFDRGYLDIDRTDEFVLVRLSLSRGRTTEAKQAFYSRLAGLLHERVGIRTEDVAVVLSENTREDWSFGRGQASYVVLPREAWR